jgi:acetyl-CoA carboxylase biotin carboxyl carrier protein
MDFKKLKEFIEIAKAAGACELKMEDGDKRYSVAFPVASSPVMMAAPQIHAVAHAAPANTGVAATSAKNDGVIEITSPFVGTYYSSPSPDTPTYVKKGDRVTKGQTMCIVEAMKIMNEIESEVAGEVIEICVENESYVEFGQVLYRIKP